MERLLASVENTNDEQLKYLQVTADGKLLVQFPSSGTSTDRELVVSTYRCKTAFTGASVGDTITATQVIDVSGATPSTVSTIWRNQSTAADLASAPSAANLELTGSTALTDAQLRASAIAIVAASLPLPAGAATAANQATSNTALASIDADIGATTDTPASADGTGNYNLIAGIKRLAIGMAGSLSNWTALLSRIPNLVNGGVPVTTGFTLGGGNSDASTQRVTLAADGPGVSQLTSINTAQTISVAAAQVVTIGAASTQSAAVGAGRNRVVLIPTVDCWIALGANPTAAKAAGSFFLPAGSQSYPISVTPGATKIAVLTDASGVTGSLSVIESV